MNPNQGPVGPGQPTPPPFTDKALEAKFSYSWTRKQLISLFNVLSPIQLPIGDMRTLVLSEVLDEIKRTAISSITEDDYEKSEPTPPPAPPTVPPAPVVN